MRASSSSTTPTSAAASYCARSASTREYTPFGYLRNPGHRASSWSAVEGGNLRTATAWLGVEWVYPLQRDPVAGFGIGLETAACRTRADFEACGLTSRYHTALMLGLDWHVDEVAVAARYFLVDDDALCARVQVTNTARQDRPVDITLTARSFGSSQGVHALAAEDVGPFELEAGTARVLNAVLARAPTEQAARDHATRALERSEARYQALLAEDAAFRATCPELAGDWPGGWREGLVYDFETTRMLVQPAGGIFHDIWPAWMVAWPRVVLAEGTLDMLRLAYADPSLAQRAVLSMFRDAPMPNVPCVFEDGSFNMVAADGSRCGTSPAWCLPFLNLELLYLRSLDRGWLGEIYPYLAAYVDWWLTQREDAEGWIVYKCTWESGEDGNPRLDPAGTGDGVIQDRIRPVELQATMAHAAGVLGFFAAELGRTTEQTRWRHVEASYRERTRQLFDPAEGRYRDWLTEEGRFQSPRPDTPYWGVDTGRFSPLALTPLLIGEPLPLEEVWLHASPPWTLWPSWTYVLVESAAAAGLHEGMGVLVADSVERVYRMTTRRELGSLARPMPGVAPEFWPEDWRTYQGHDGYGWGATTANLLIRHLFGFKESHATGGWRAELTPAFPRSWLEPGRRYAMHRLNYRGLVFDLAYTAGDTTLHAELNLGDHPRRCRVRAPDLAYDSRRALSVHRFQVRNGCAHQLSLG